MRRFLLLAIATASAVAPHAVQAQTYPLKPVTLVSPFAAGGTSDVVSRAVGTRMSATLGQPVIIVNRTGAGGTIGIGSTAAAPPDGYTLVMGGLGSVVFSAGVYGTKLKFDPQKQLEPIAPVAVVPTVIVVRADSPFKALGELVQTAKSHPGKVRYGSAGVGGTLHIAGELFERIAKVQLTHVPYKGGAPAVTDLLAGNIEAVFGDVTLVKSYTRRVRSVRSPWPARRDHPSCRTCRRPPSWVYRVSSSTPGMRCLRRKACRPRPPNACAKRSPQRSRHPKC